MGTRERVGRPIQADRPAWPVEDAATGEAALIERCRTGDAASFTPLVRMYQDRVYNLCFRMCGAHAEAEDFAQEAFVRAYQSIDRFDGRARFYTWLFRIAVNLVISRRRRTARVRMQPLDGDGDGRAWTAGAVDGGPVAAACENERHMLVHAALAELDEEQRCIITLRDLESLSYDEIADILNVPAGTVKSRLHRARMALREKLLPHFEA